MTFTQQLARRVSRLEPLDGGPVTATPDIRVLDEEARNRMIVLLRAKLAGEADQETGEQIAAILMLCPWTVGSEKMLPPYLLRALQKYWRHQKVAEYHTLLPGGDYDLFFLKFVPRRRLMSLCLRYGWDHTSDLVDILPLPQWDDADVAELCQILEQASPENHSS